MALTASELAVVSRLLDDALELDEPGRQRWLLELPAEHAALVPALREMLARKQGASMHPLDRPPRLPDALPESRPASSGDEVGPYRLIRELGHGGMGMVWLAERADGTLKRHVALKLPVLAWEAGLGQRMRRERDILAALEHPNIARLYDAGLDALGRPYLAMEYAEGVPIDVYCREHGLSVVERLRLFLQVSRAVAHAHARLIVHRDLKPTNILVGADGTARLLDFGIAKLLDDSTQGTQLTAALGRALTPAYASPEQLKGESITVASDVYALGVLLYELLTGRLPHDRRAGATWEFARLEDEPPAASSVVADRALARALRGDLDAILAKALRGDLKERYATVDAFADDLQRFLDGEPVRAQADTVGYRLRKALRRHWRVAGASAAVLLAVLVGAGVAMYQAQRATRALERERAVREFVGEVFRADARSPAHGPELQTLPASAFLERSGRLVQARFSTQPALQAELYGVVSGTFTHMGAYRLAAEYARRQIDVLTTTGSKMQELAHAHVAMATLLLQEKRLDEAEKSAGRAIELASNDPSVQIDARIVLARVALERRGREAAILEIKEIEAMLARDGAHNGVAAAWVEAIRAAVLVNRRDESLALYDAAIARALTAEGSQSPAAIEIRLAVASSLASTAFVERAQTYFDAAVTELRARGGDHATRAALEAAEFATRRYVSFSQITSGEALRVVAEARAAISAAGRVVPAELAARLLFLEAQINLKWEDLEAALSLTEQSVPLLIKADPAPSQRWAYANHYGRLFMRTGRHDEADHWLRERFRLRVEMGAADHPFHAFDHVVVAQNLAMQSRFGEALAFLDSTPRFEPIRGEGSLNPDRYNLHVQLARAEILVQSGDAQRALAIFPHAILAGDRWDAHAGFAVLGELQCALGRLAEGMKALHVAMQPRTDERDNEHSPGLARLRAVAGNCVLRQGNRQQAIVLARRARTAFDAQPHAAPYFWQPLLKLEAALGILGRSTRDGVT